MSVLGLVYEELFLVESSESFQVLLKAANPTKNEMTAEFGAIISAVSMDQLEPGANTSLYVEQRVRRISVIR